MALEICPKTLKSVQEGSFPAYKRREFEGHAPKDFFWDASQIPHTARVLNMPLMKTYSNMEEPFPVKIGVQ